MNWRMGANRAVIGVHLGRYRDVERLQEAQAQLGREREEQRLSEGRVPSETELASAEAAVARELTKLHEELRRDDLAGLAAHYRDAGPPKGEAVVVVGPPKRARRCYVQNRWGGMRLRRR